VFSIKSTTTSIDKRLPSGPLQAERPPGALVAEQNVFSRECVLCTMCSPLQNVFSIECVLYRMGAWALSPALIRLPSTPVRWAPGHRVPAGVIAGVQYVDSGRLSTSVGARPIGHMETFERCVYSHSNFLLPLSGPEEQTAVHTAPHTVPVPERIARCDAVRCVPLTLNVSWHGMVWPWSRWVMRSLTQSYGFIRNKLFSGA